MNISMKNEINKRSIAGKAIKYTFIGFNLIMMVLCCYLIFFPYKIVFIGQYAAPAVFFIARLICLMVATFFWVSGCIIIGLFVHFTRQR